MNDSVRIEMFTPETLNHLQTTFFNRVKQEGADLGIAIDFANLTSVDGFNFKTVMEGKLVTDEAQKAMDRKVKEFLKMNDLKTGDTAIIYNRPWKVTGYDPSKYRRTVELTNDNGKKIYQSPENVHQGIAEYGQAVSKKKPAKKAPVKKVDQAPAA